MSDVNTKVVDIERVAKVTKKVDIDEHIGLTQLKKNTSKSSK